MATPVFRQSGGFGDEGMPPPSLRYRRQLPVSGGSPSYFQRVYNTAKSPWFFAGIGIIAAITTAGIGLSKANSALTKAEHNEAIIPPPVRTETGRVMFDTFTTKESRYIQRVKFDAPFRKPPTVQLATVEVYRADPSHAYSFGAHGITEEGFTVLVNTYDTHPLNLLEVSYMAIGY